MQPASNLAESLCTRCGLCCDGTLFEGIRIRPGDTRKIWKGLAGEEDIQKRLIPQPCPALKNETCCTIYAERPDMCRKFDCGILIRVQSGELDSSEAHRLIRLARRRRNEVRKLLDQLGFWKPTEPISDSYHRAFSAPWDLSEGDEILKQRERLHRSVNRLEAVLNAEFLLET